MTGQIWVGIGAVSGMLSVILGAFGAHGLSGKLTERGMEVYHLAAQYQMYHALAIVGFGLWALSKPGLSSVPPWAFLVGTLLFSGSLYALAITEVKILGAITPLGGTAFIIGWAAFAYQAFKG